ncbi:MAG: M1 family metallopeptidase [Saprospiraceae bacterium]
MKLNISLSQILSICALNIIGFVLHFPAKAQVGYWERNKYTRNDTLLGGLPFEKTCYDVLHYDLKVRLEPETKSISGKNKITFNVLKATNKIQIDLAARLAINSILCQGKNLKFTREFDAVFVENPAGWPIGKASIIVNYGGKPQEAVKPPWETGLIWKTDKSGNPYLAVTCEGDGASIWWPCKSHLSDRPDSVRLTIEAPEMLTVVSNGRLRNTINLPGNYKATTWAVTYPINTFNVTFYAAKYVHFSDKYQSILDPSQQLDLNYYVLPENEAKARIHFEQTKEILSCYEQLLGPYPFWGDGYQLIESPYLGMEHQSAIAYGNEFKRGYLGKRITPELNFDYIILHESGHEYFGNSIYVTDYAEMWLNEGFTTYLEYMYVKCHDGAKSAIDYLRMLKALIASKEPVLGQMNVNFDRGSTTDKYYKGAWILHTMGSTFKDEKAWFEFIKKYYQTFAGQAMMTDKFVRFANEESGRDWTVFFKQYLTESKIPTLNYSFQETENGILFQYFWSNVIPEFSFPIYMTNKSGKKIKLNPTSSRQEMVLLGKLEDGWQFDQDVLVDFVSLH